MLTGADVIKYIDIVDDYDADVIQSDEFGFLVTPNQRLYDALNDEYADDGEDITEGADCIFYSVYHFNYMPSSTEGDYRLYCHIPNTRFGDFEIFLDASAEFQLAKKVRRFMEENIDFYRGNFI